MSTVDTPALIGRTGFEVDAVDLFCGYGGSSQGIHRAGVTVRAAANHNQIAIDTHAANFPDTDHWRADLVDKDASDYVDVRDLPRARFLWASPSCKHHSKANAQRIYEQGHQGALPGFGNGDDLDGEAYANSERSRVSMSCVLRYAAHHRPELVIVENVIEVTKWGPNQDGTTFKWWLGELDKLGYNVQPCWLNSMFFGVPQSRDRVYFVCSRKGNPLPDVEYRPAATCTSDACQGARVEAVQTWKRRTAAWMLPTWGRYNDQYTYTCPDCRARVHPDVRPASDIIDWSIPATPIGERKRPLAPATRARILAGLQRYGWAPVVTAAAGNVYETTPGNRARPVTKPLATQTATATHALATAPGFLFNTAHGGRSVPLDQPHPTVCAFDDRHHLVIPLRNNGRARPTNEPLPTLCATGQHHALVVRNNTGGAEMATPITEPVRTITTTVGAQSLLVPYYGNGTAQTTGRPAPTVTTHDRCSLVIPDDLDVRDLDAYVDHSRLRMLEADPELRGASGFAPQYILLGTKKQIVEGLGNAVSPAPSEWLTSRAVATLSGVAA